MNIPNVKNFGVVLIIHPSKTDFISATIEGDEIHVQVAGNLNICQVLANGALLGIAAKIESLVGLKTPEGTNPINN